MLAAKLVRPPSGRAAAGHQHVAARSVDLVGKQDRDGRPGPRRGKVAIGGHDAAWTLVRRARTCNDDLVASAMAPEAMVPQKPRKFGIGPVSHIARAGGKA